MQLTEGKNYKVVNQFAISYDLINPNLKFDFPIKIYGKFDLLVDGKIKESPEDFWLVLKDLDGTTYAQPMDASILALKLMSGGYVPAKNGKPQF